LDYRSCWTVFIHIVRGRPGGLLQFSKGEAVKVFLASVSSGIPAMCPNREKHHACTIAERCGCLDVHVTCTTCQTYTPSHNEVQAEYVWPNQKTSFVNMELVTRRILLEPDALRYLHAVLVSSVH